MWGEQVLCAEDDWPCFTNNSCVSGRRETSHWQFALTFYFSASVRLFISLRSSVPCFFQSFFFFLLIFYFSGPQLWWCFSFNTLQWLSRWGSHCVSVLVSSGTHTEEMVLKQMMVALSHSVWLQHSPRFNDTHLPETCRWRVSLPAGGSISPTGFSHSFTAGITSKKQRTSCWCVIPVPPTESAATSLQRRLQNWGLFFFAKWWKPLCGRCTLKAWVWQCC